MGAIYKAGGNSNNDFRHRINEKETLKQFDERFAQNEIFKSASEICDIYLVPASATRNSMNTFWGNYQLTGDNLRERPYSDLYPRLTTQSNVYTVHYRVQTLKGSKDLNAHQWVEDDSRITGEFRGSALIERYVDPSESGLPDFATSTSATLASYYRFKIVSVKQFTP